MTMYFTKDHEWISVRRFPRAPSVITELRPKRTLGDIVYAEVPEKGRKVHQGTAIPPW